MYLALERYSRPSSPDECLRLLAEPSERAALLAGGTELNTRGHEHITHLIDLQELPLREIKVEDNVLRIGALVTLSELRRHFVLRGQLLTCLREAAGGYANVALQNRSTIGGRILVDRGDQDLPPALLALGARLELLALSADGVIEERRIDYPTGEARSALQGALLTEVQIPLSAGSSAHRRFGRTAVDAPLANVSAVRRDDAVLLATNVQGSGASSLTRLSEAEALVASWNGERPADWRAQARQAVETEAGAYGDAWASGDYRRDLTGTMTVRALAAVWGEEEVQA